MSMASDSGALDGWSRWFAATASSASRIDGRGRDEPGNVAANFDHPVVAMNFMVVFRTEQYTVLKIGFTGAAPPHHVMSFRMTRRKLTVAPGASAKSLSHRDLLCPAEQSLRYSEVENFAVPAENHGDDLRFRSQPPRCSR